MKTLLIVLTLLTALGCATAPVDKDIKQEEKTPINEVIRALEKIPFPRF